MLPRRCGRLDVRSIPKSEPRPSAGNAGSAASGAAVGRPDESCRRYLAGVLGIIHKVLKFDEFPVNLFHQSGVERVKALVASVRKQLTQGGDPHKPSRD